MAKGNDIHVAFLSDYYPNQKPQNQNSELNH